ncbi:MAG: endopeptidase La [Deltaproteobacteria bacterium]|nr:endopeptidase La [Deltaproteobacteria bacterium]MBW2416226.1 endopeptidase La [Deltaproteobacteria bacterium]
MSPEDPTTEDPTTEGPAAQESEQTGEVEEQPLVTEEPLPAELPILPLRNTVLFPTLVTPMLATSDRAQRLVTDALQGDRLFVVVAARDAEVEEPAPADLYGVGTAVRIVRMAETEEGAQHLWVQGVRRVKVGAYAQEAPFLRAAVEEHDLDLQPSLDLEALHRNVSTQFLQFTEDGSGVPDAVRALVSGLDDSGVLSDVVASNLGLSVADRQEILETTEVRQRLERLSEHLAREQEVRRLESEIREQVQEELSKSQREYMLREQARAIRRQLGESDVPEEQIEALRQRLDEAGVPDALRDDLEREIQRLESLPPGAMEAGTLRTYLEWIADLPWGSVTEDVLDVARAREILDEDHYDLEKVKDRILEFIAVLKLKRDMKGPILCFVGPPGTGKTSLGRSIARAMGREFARLALGGVRDEAEIRGHRRTYVGALPGRLIQIMKRVGTRNPVVMLDEIDKLGTDFRGDPASALLEVLDPEQNHAFSDHYLEVPFDLSQVLFIATANNLDTVPPALLDRMELIEVVGYTEEDKVEIARRYLLPRQLERHGLKDRGPQFSDAALHTVIRGYTREAGLRNLERELGKVARKVARRVVEQGDAPERIEPDDLATYLGPVKFEPEVAGRLENPGVAVGLAWTQAGGEILFFEATRMPGKGGLKITGSLGDVMRESVEIAVAAVRTRAKALGLEPELFAHSDLHVHVPSGSTPKDGPSAGVALVTALTSLLTDRAVPPDLAMTGEITLRGKVLPVGGIKEKVLAAKRAGISRVLLPSQNEKDLSDVPSEQLEGLEVIRVETIDEVLEQTFGKDLFK